MTTTTSFTHLHLHTQYSLLDGAIRVKDLFPKLVDLKMNTVAVTDHGNLFGAAEISNEAKKTDTKLIFGCETYIASTDRRDRTNRRNYHLVLLAQNDVGYRNLSYLNSMGYLEGFYYNPRIDKQILREHSDGLIGMSACLGGEIAQTLEKEGVVAAEEVAKEYAAIFAPGDFYLELMPTKTTEQDTLNGELVRMGKKLGIPIVATNDCHYIAQSDAQAHDVLMAIQTGKSVADDQRLKHVVDSYYMKSQAEMEMAFRDIPEALENTIAIANRCNVQLKLGQTCLPKYKVPDDENLDTYIATLTDRGLERRFQELTARGVALDPDRYRERCKHELGVIQKMGFSSYFLIVWDFIRWAKAQDIPVGPGRGSGAGSCVAWALRITDIDPLEFKLLFERFLNPDRVSMPDFDVDFCMNRRGEVIQYVQEKYGREQVGQIATFHQLKARGVIRDIARVMEIPFGEADRLAKLVPEPVQGKSPSVREAIDQVPDLRQLYNESSTHRQLLDLAASLEGLNRNAGMHAAGIVIADKPLWEYVPCFRGQNDEIVTQFAMNEVEKAGLVKFDFLGLKTLTVIRTALSLINAQRPADDRIDIDTIDRSDPQIFKMIAHGDTTGVFQLESSGCREMLKKLRPDCLEDIIAAVALYRPGPLEGGMVDDFIDRKHGHKKVEYPHPWLEDVLADTYGVIVYQEQVMQIAQVLGGYSLGGADLLRRAMGKKKPEEMAKQKTTFLEGAHAKGVAPAVAAHVFELMEFFAGYGFNRSHSAAYGWITYQTAWLKHHYPHEFMAGLMTCDADNIDNIIKFIAEARAMGLTVERPDVNESALDFTVTPKESALGAKIIRFGMGAVKGVGATAVEAILNTRRAEGPFKSLFDLCRRVDAQKCNRRVIEPLIKSGALDGLGEHLHRAQLLDTLDAALSRGSSEQKDRRTGQTSLFGMFATTQHLEPEVYSKIAPWEAKELLAFEKAAIGFYVSGHPLDRWRDGIARIATAITSDFSANLKRHGDYTIGGIVGRYKEIITRKGDKMARFHLEDYDGSIEVIAFPKTFATMRHVFVSEEPILCFGTVQNEGMADAPEWKMLLKKAALVADVQAKKTSQIDIQLDVDRLTEERMETLKMILAVATRGKHQAVLRLRQQDHSETIITLPSEWNAAPTDELLRSIDRLFGACVASLV